MSHYKERLLQSIRCYIPEQTNNQSHPPKHKQSSKYTTFCAKKGRMFSVNE